MKTEELIKQLSQSNQKVDPLASPWFRFFRWLFVSALLVVGSIALIGFCPKLGMNLQDPFFVSQLGALIFASLSAALCAFYLNVPGSPKNKNWLWAPFIGIFIWMASTIAELGLYSAGAEFARQGMSCATTSISVAVIPAFALFFWLRKGASTDLKRSGLYAGLSAISFGCIGALLINSTYAPQTILLAQFIPVLMLSLAGIYIGRKLLHW